MDAARPGGGDAVGGAGNTRVARRESGEDATGRGGPERDAARAARGRGVSRLTRYTKSDPEARSDRTSQMQSVLSGHGSTFFMIMLCGVQKERTTERFFTLNQSTDDCRHQTTNNHNHTTSYQVNPATCQLSLRERVRPTSIVVHLAKQTETRQPAAACAVCLCVPPRPVASRRHARQGAHGA